jgi:hypothetical protein
MMNSYKTPIYRLTDQYSFPNQNNTSKNNKLSGQNNTTSNIKSFFTANSKSIDRKVEGNGSRVRESTKNVNMAKNRISSSSSVNKVVNKESAIDADKMTK